MGLRIFQVSLSNQDAGQIGVGLCRSGIKTKRSGKFIGCFIESASLLQSLGVIGMRPGGNRKIGGDPG